MNKAFLILFCIILFSCMRNNINTKCFKDNTKAELNLGYYSLSFDTLKVDSALYYNNRAFSLCPDSKKILQTRLNIFDLKKDYKQTIKTINKLIVLDSMKYYDKLDLRFKKSVYFLCIDSVKYKDSIRKEYLYLLDQPKEWKDSLLYQYRLGLLEYKLFGKEYASNRLDKLKDYNIFIKSAIINLKKDKVTPFSLLLQTADIYHPLNDNREKAYYIK